MLGYSHTGVHQGDPLGGTYHNIGLQPTLVKLDERVREDAHRAMPRDREPPCAVFAIHDDNYVAVPLEQANAVARIVDETFEEDGLQLNPNKCKIVSKRRRCGNTIPHYNWGLGIALAWRLNLAPQAGDGDTPIALLSLDQKNAFNISRRDNNLAYSHSGVHQGDPLGGTYQNIGFQPTLVKRSSELKL